MVFCPSWVTSHTGPIFSVISMGPAGRKASRHGRVKVVTAVMLKGMLASGFCSPALLCAQTAADTKISSNAVFAKFIFIVISPYLYPHQDGFCFGVQLYPIRRL